MDFSALTRQCLNRRFPTQVELQTHVLAWAAERNERSIKITWQFTVSQARETLNRQYLKLNPVNLKYKKT